MKWFGAVMCTAIALTITMFLMFININLLINDDNDGLFT